MGDQLARPGMAGMALDDDGASRGQGGGGVAAGSAVREREVARAEDGDRAQRLEHAPDVGLGDWATTGLTGIDAGLDPAALADLGGEHLECVDGALALRDQPRRAEAGLV